MEKGLLLCPKQCLSHVELYEVSPSSAQKPFFPLADRPTADYLFFSLSLPLSDLVWSLTSILALWPILFNTFKYILRAKLLKDQHEGKINA